ncbi:MAG TPA: hypothetical protein VEQ37_20145 [Actinomycetota bacterium]|nr:hypothetical protein [Actinomycetota bacterium]
MTSRTSTSTYDDYGRVLTDQNAAGTVDTYAADATLLACVWEDLDPVLNASCTTMPSGRRPF